MPVAKQILEQKAKEYEKLFRESVNLPEDEVVRIYIMVRPKPMMKIKTLKFDWDKPLTDEDWEKILKAKDWTEPSRKVLEIFRSKPIQELTLEELGLECGNDRVIKLINYSFRVYHLSYWVGKTKGHHRRPSKYFIARVVS